MICGFSLAIFILYCLIIFLFGCAASETSNIPPTVIVIADDSTIIMQAQTTLKGSVSGDSIVSTLWVFDDSAQQEDVFIESPDSLSTKVYLKKKGIYTFTLWALNSRNLLDSSQTTITVR